MVKRDLFGIFEILVRCSTGKAYLRPARNRPNLHVVENTLVTKILFDGSTKTTTGVQFVRNGQVVIS